MESLQEKKVYILQGDMADYDYLNFGVFTSKKELLQAAEEIIAKDFALAEVYEDSDGFSGLVGYERTIGMVTNNGNRLFIRWDKENSKAYLEE